MDAVRQITLNHITIRIAVVVVIIMTASGRPRTDKLESMVQKILVKLDGDDKRRENRYSCNRCGNTVMTKNDASKKGAQKVQ